MKNAFRLAVTLPVLAVLIAGCAAVPSVQDVATNGPNPPSIIPSCGENLGVAQNCGRYVADKLVASADKLAKWEAGYSSATLGAGLLGVIYTKSSRDRSQAIEDLAVVVAGITGVRGIARPKERRNKFLEAEAALACMMKAAQSIPPKGVAIATAPVGEFPDSTPPILLSGMAVLSSGSNGRDKLRFESLVRGHEEVQRQTLDSWKRWAAAHAGVATEAEAAFNSGGPILATGIDELLRVLRRDLGDLSAASAESDLLGTQRKVVEDLIGTLAKKISAEKVAAETAKSATPMGLVAIGALATVILDNTIQKSLTTAANAIAAADKAPTDSALTRGVTAIYTECTGTSPVP